MIEFTCPSCSAKCRVGDEMAGRKMKCPKCGTRIRHHRDGTVELLSLSPAPPPPPPAAPSAPAAAAPAPPPHESTAVLPHAAQLLLSQNEGRQNTVVLWGVGGFLALALSGVGLFLGLPALAVGPIALLLLAAFAALVLRAKRREVAVRRESNEAKTEPLAKI